MINVSINPTYLCNLRCEHCYLTPAQLSNRERLDLTVLRARLQTLHELDTISHIDIYGGEISTLPDEYVYEMIDISSLYTRSINIVTNYVVPKSWAEDSRISLSVSFDGPARARHVNVLHNLKKLTRDVHILVLATPAVIDFGVLPMIKLLTQVPRLTTIEIKQYSPNQSNTLKVTDLEYEQYVKEWIDHVPDTVLLTNEHKLVQTTLYASNSFSSDHVYITPSGSFAVLEFDTDSNEFFKEYQTFDGVLEWMEHERLRVLTSTVCGPCDYVGRCLSEHLRPVSDTKSSCNGHIQLIEWYKNERLGT